MKNINQTVIFKAKASDVYKLLMDSKKHSEFSGAKAEISSEVGGKNSCYDGWIESENIEFEPDKKIVQKWRGKDWPDGHYSKCTFEFKDTDEGCELKFTQTDIPDDKVEHIDSGWVKMYWDKMKKYLG